MVGMGVKERYLQAKAELERECVRAGRNPDDVVLVAVSKTVGPEAVAEAMEAGAHDFGENRPDELLRKAAAHPGERWHFIGNIQSRRIHDIVAHACLIHSLYQEHHARKIDEAARAAGKVQQVMLEVNVSGEESKSGVEPACAAELLRACAELPCVQVRGLMTMAPQGDSQVARQVFEELAHLRDELRKGLDGDAAAAFDGLSMGMSEDWREAVWAGATMVRIGRAVFSDDFQA